MCETGVLIQIQEFQQAGMGALAKLSWKKVPDGVGERAYGRANPELAEIGCPRCLEKLPVVRRVLDQEAYNLPDAAVDQRIQFGRPCIAIGIVDAQRRSGLVPTDDARGRWQGILWETCRVAFLEFTGDAFGRFQPQQKWDNGRPRLALDSLVGEMNRCLAAARTAGKIPASGKRRSVETEKRVEEALRPALQRIGYTFAGRQVPVCGFWWLHKIDLLYRELASGGTLATEIKVDENWRQPVNQPLADLLVHSAVINLRIPPRGASLKGGIRQRVELAQRMLETSDRVRFLTIP